MRARFDPLRNAKVSYGIQCSSLDADKRKDEVELRLFGRVPSSVTTGKQKLGWTAKKFVTQCVDADNPAPI